MKTNEVPILSMQQKYNALALQEHQTEQLVWAAWKLTRYSLWPKDSIELSEIDRCKDFIRNYIQLLGNSKSAFKSFCTRIILAREYYELYPLRLTDSCDWLTADHDEGFVSTLTWYQQLLYNREHFEGFRWDIEFFVSFLHHYTLHPSSKSLRECRRTLHRYQSDDFGKLLKKIIKPYSKRATT